jgi:hypothetical protein
VLCHGIKSVVENLIFLCRAILDNSGPIERRWQVCRKWGKQVRVTGRGSFGLAVGPSEAKPAVALPVALGAAAPVTDPMPLTDQDVGISGRDRNLTRPRTSLAFRACIGMSIMNPVRYLLRRSLTEGTTAAARHCFGAGWTSLGAGPVCGREGTLATAAASRTLGWEPSTWAGVQLFHWFEGLRDTANASADAPTHQREGACKDCKGKAHAISSKGDFGAQPKCV